MNIAPEAEFCFPPEIRAWIDEVFNYLQRNGFPEVLDHPGSTKRRARLLEIFNRTDDEDYRLERMVDEAWAGDPEIDRILRHRAALHVRRGELVPEPLREFVVDALAGMGSGLVPKKRGRIVLATAERDIQICFSIEHLRVHGEFRPTRNDATRSKESVYSGCSIVTVALKRLGSDLSERAVEEIWAQNHKTLFREISHISPV